MKLLNNITYKRPLIMVLILMTIAMLFRLLDIFVFRLDQLLGEIILSKTLGFALIVMYISLIGKKPHDLGYNNTNTNAVLIFGVTLPIIFLGVGYLTEYAANTDTIQSISFGIVNLEANTYGKFSFVLFLIISAIINCLMEEGLFRGIMIPALLTKFKPRKAIIIQAVLFGIWHLPWAFKGIMSADASTFPNLLSLVLIYFAPALLVGLVYGVMFYYTNSIWTPWLAHFINNTVLRLIHTNYANSLDAGIVLRVSIYLVLLLLSIPAIIIYSNIKGVKKDLNFSISES